MLGARLTFCGAWPGRNHCVTLRLYQFSRGANSISDTRGRHPDLGCHLRSPAAAQRSPVGPAILRPTTDPWPTSDPQPEIDSNWLFLITSGRDGGRESTSIHVYGRKVSQKSHKEKNEWPAGRPAVITPFRHLYLWNGMINSRGAC